MNAVQVKLGVDNPSAKNEPSRFTEVKRNDITFDLGERGGSPIQLTGAR